MKTEISLRRVAFMLLVVSIIILVVFSARPQMIHFLAGSTEEAQFKMEAAVAIPKAIQSVSIQGIFLGIFLYFVALLLEYREFRKNRTMRSR